MVQLHAPQFHHSFALWDSMSAPVNFALTCFWCLPFTKNRLIRLNTLTNLRYFSGSTWILSFWTGVLSESGETQVLHSFPCVIQCSLPFKNSLTILEGDDHSPQPTFLSKPKPIQSLIVFAPTFLRPRTENVRIQQPMPLSSAFGS